MEKTNKATCFNNPQITGFFTDYDQNDCGALLWQLFKLSTVANRTEILSVEEWFNLLSFYESLDELLKTMYMNYTKQQS
ncbi:hypothetical protein DBR11_28970 [Pedobacter sp. HMWF019]|uniref:hypothetical protein n=1 Tax=Pedobacter sp. HMWF019 TaxID=2056856 RepID=UPI000D3D0272|nr:hypothetical protein [Pedobacter sp. HMWF019]PTS91497.1 hypothetical protein DBR11_28970 [Pedobacter sp. HMWF019]